jgi:hypothetical protein
MDSEQVASVEVISEVVYAEIGHLTTRSLASIRYF